MAEIRHITGHAEAEGSAAILLGYMRRHGAGVKHIKDLVLTSGMINLELARTGYEGRVGSFVALKP